MKTRIFAIAALFASLLAGAASLKAETVADHSGLNPGARMTYSNIAVAGGRQAAVAVQGYGNSLLRVAVFDYNNNLIAQTICRVNTCVLTWVAFRNADFYVTVDNVGGYFTTYGFAVTRL